jgi:UDP-glucose 4-epimerase
MKVMITGGAGYIGSHTCVELIRAGYSTVIFDNFCNSHPEVLNRIRDITGVAPALVRGDIRYRAELAQAFATHRCDAVLHLAGLKSIAESVARPPAYYQNNVIGALALIRSMRDAGVEKLVFASSATVYGEERPLTPSNSYG